MILVTGSAGFIGQALIQHLLAAGRSVIALDRVRPDLPSHPKLTTLVGDLADPSCLEAAFGAGARSVVHLAAVPGGAAEADPDMSFKVNVAGTLGLMRAAARAVERPRFVLASTIAVLGEPLPADGVSDMTAACPKLVYGFHKHMAEVALSAMTRRGEIDGVALRLPGIVARPAGGTGLKSAFMSEVFHALLARRPITLPVSEAARFWLMSVAQCTFCLEHGLSVEAAELPETRVMTLPALHVGMAELVGAITSETGADASLASYLPDHTLEAAFGAYPALSATAAERAGFSHDGTLDQLVRRTLERVKS